MYSKNDYRYYLEHRMAEDNYLAHYGVKGMKWKHHKKKLSTNELRESEHAQVDAWNARVRETKGKMDPVEAIGRTSALYTTAKMREESYPQAKVKKVINKVKKSKNPLAPKNQKVEIITDKKKKRTKREAKWNKEMQNYGKEILAEQNKKKR